MENIQKLLFEMQVDFICAFKYEDKRTKRPHLRRNHSSVLAKGVLRVRTARGIICYNPISFPESSFPLTSGRKSRALGATISGMRRRWRLRSETGWAESGYFLCYFKMVAPRALDSCRRPEGS